MKFSTVAAAATAVSMASAMTDEQVQEINAIVKDINANQAAYIGLELNPPAGFTMPAELLQLYQKVLTYTDESYTTLLADLDYNMITSTITNFEWYSDRLLPALEAVRKSYGAEDDAKTTSTKAEEKTTSTKAAATSTKAKETSTKAAETSTKAEETTTSTKAKETTTKAKETATSAKATTQAISQIGDGQIQQTATISQQTANGAAKAVAGLGAGAIAAAALLL